jgi:hypothetical protein
MPVGYTDNDTQDVDAAGEGEESGEQERCHPPRRREIGEYRMVGQTMVVTITDKHWLLPWPVVEVRLRELLK